MGMRSAQRILIVDDHTIVREGLKLLLKKEIAARRIGEAASGERAVELAAGGRWDLVLLDISLPGRSGIDVLNHIKAKHPELPVLVLSMHPEDQYALRALRSGAAGYITKDCVPADLVSAIRKIESGGRYISAAVAEQLADELNAPPRHRPPHTGLSDREYDVLRLIAQGGSVSEIARRLNLSIKTVSTYRARLLRKMQMKTNAELIQYAVRRGLTD